MSISSGKILSALNSFENTCYIVVNALMNDHKRQDFVKFLNANLKDYALEHLLLSGKTIFRIKAHLTVEALKPLIDQYEKTSNKSFKLEIKSEAEYKSFLAECLSQEYRSIFAGLEELYTKQIYQCYEQGTLGELEFDLFDKHFSSLLSQDVRVASELSQTMLEMSSVSSSTADQMEDKNASEALAVERMSDSGFEQTMNNLSDPVFDRAKTLAKGLEALFMLGADCYTNAVSGIFLNSKSEELEASESEESEDRGDLSPANLSKTKVNLKRQLWKELSSLKCKNVFTLTDTDMWVVEDYSDPFDVKSKLTKEEQQFILKSIRTKKDQTEFLGVLDKLYALRQSGVLKMTQEEFVAIKALHDLYHNTRVQFIGSTYGLTQSGNAAAHQFECEYFTEQFKRQIISAEKLKSMDWMSDEILRRKHIAVQRWFELNTFSSIQDKNPDESKMRDESQRTNVEPQPEKSPINRKRKLEEPVQNTSDDGYSKGEVYGQESRGEISSVLPQNKTFADIFEQTVGDPCWRFCGTPRAVMDSSEKILEWVYENPLNLTNAEVNEFMSPAIETASHANKPLNNQKGVPLLKQWLLGILNQPSKEGARIFCEQQHRPWFSAVIKLIQDEMKGEFPKKLSLLAKHNPVAYLRLCLNNTWLDAEQRLEELASELILRFEQYPDAIEKSEFDATLRLLNDRTFGEVPEYLFSALGRILSGFSTQPQHATICAKWGGWFMENPPTIIDNLLKRFYLREHHILYPWLVLAERFSSSSTKEREEKTKTETKLLKLSEKEDLVTRVNDFVRLALEDRPKTLVTLRTRILIQERSNHHYPGESLLVDKKILEQLAMSWSKMIASLLKLDLDKLPIREKEGAFILDLSIVNRGSQLGSIQGVCLLEALKDSNMLSGEGSELMFSPGLFQTDHWKTLKEQRDHFILKFKIAFSNEFLKRLISRIEIAASVQEINLFILPFDVFQIASEKDISFKLVVSIPDHRTSNDSDESEADHLRSLLFVSFEEALSKNGIVYSHALSSNKENTDPGTIAVVTIDLSSKQKNEALGNIYNITETNQLLDKLMMGTQAIFLRYKANREMASSKVEMALNALKASPQPNEVSSSSASLNPSTLEGITSQVASLNSGSSSSVPIDMSQTVEMSLEEDIPLSSVRPGDFTRVVQQANSANPGDFASWLQQASNALPASFAHSIHVSPAREGAAPTLLFRHSLSSTIRLIENDLGSPAPHQSRARGASNEAGSAGRRQRVQNSVPIFDPVHIPSPASAPEPVPTEEVNPDPHPAPRGRGRGRGRGRARGRGRGGR